MKVKMKPVCDCGHVFEELYIGPGKSGIFENKCLLMPSTVISPSVCPNCGEPIECVMTQWVASGSVLDYNVDKYNRFSFNKGGIE